MDRVEPIALLVGGLVIGVAIAVVLIFPPLGGDYRNGQDTGSGGDAG